MTPIANLPLELLNHAVSLFLDETGERFTAVEDLRSVALFSTFVPNWRASGEFELSRTRALQHLTEVPYRTSGLIAPFRALSSPLYRLPHVRTSLRIGDRLGETPVLPPPF